MISERIDIFLDAGRELNFSAVAKKRYTNQSTISRQIQDLEREWGFSLFERSNKGLRLTPQGAVMLECCRKIDRQMNDGLHRARKLKAGTKDKLRLGFLTDMNVEKLFIPVILQCAAENDGLDISLLYGSFGELRRGLKGRTADIIFTYDFEIGNLQEPAVVDYLMDRKPCIVMAENHPLCRKKELTIGDLKNELFFIPEEEDSPGRERDLQYLLRACHISEGRVRFVPNQESVFLQVRLGRGVGLSDTDAEQIRKYRLRSIPIGGDGKYGKLGLVAVWKKDNLNPFIALFMQKLHGTLPNS